MAEWRTAQSRGVSSHAVTVRARNWRRDWKGIPLAVGVLTLTVCSACSSSPQSAASSTSYESVTATAPPLSTTSPSITTTTSTPKVEASASYQDTSGDKATVQIAFSGVLSSNAVPSAVASGCSQQVNYDPERSLWIEEYVTLTLSSSLPTQMTLWPAQGGIYWDGYNTTSTSSGSSDSPSGSATEDASGYCFITGNEGDTQLNEMSPGESTQLIYYLFFPNTITPQYPSGDPSQINDVAWSFPGIEVSNNSTSLQAVSASGPYAYFGLGCISPNDVALYSPFAPLPPLPADC